MIDQVILFQRGLEKIIDNYIKYLFKDSTEESSIVSKLTLRKHSF